MQRGTVEKRIGARSPSVDDIPGFDAGDVSHGPADPRQRAIDPLGSPLALGMRDQVGSVAFAFPPDTA